MAVLSASAALSAGLALALQDRTLAADLERAAQQRLERAGQAANRLVDSHLVAIRERYQAVSGTPQLRATLEVEDAPTLEYYANGLRERQGAALLAFLDRSDSAVVVVGDRELLSVAQGVSEAALVSHADRAYAVVSAELETSAGRVGRMLAAELVEPATLEHWSELCGVSVHLAPPGSVEPAALTRSARELGALDLVVATGLEAERAALRRSRVSLLVAGSFAVALSLAACVLLARGFVRPILEIQHATDRIRAGALDVRLGSRRRDEIGDVARAFDQMLDGLEASRREVDRHVAELRRSEEHLANAQELARLGSFEFEIEKGRATALWGSGQLRALFQVDPGNAPLAPEALLARVHPEDRDALETAAREAFEGGSALRTDFRILLPDDSEHIVHARAELKRDRDGQPVRLEGTVQDVTDRRHAQEQIRYLAHHDSLTGLGNRVLFTERLELAVAHARRRGTRLGVLFVDLDRFKRINDNLGPRVGDSVLCESADRLLRSLRDTDVVARLGEQETAISRLAGDEFILLVNRIHDAQDLAHVAARLLYSLERPLEADGRELVLSASIGIAVWPGDGDDADALLRNAGSAAEHAKAQGGNRYEFYDESMNVATTEFLELETRIRRGLSRGEFEMHYQPKVSLRDGRVTGYEALMRWRDPERGIVSPAVFIPAAEQCGLIVPLGIHALREACLQLATWTRELPAGDSLRVAVNLSARQFRGGGLVEEVAAVLDETGAPPEQLELEITETAVMHDEKGVVSDLERLRGMGLSISLDDFGTGQSSLSYLRRLPVDTLKIDMSFVRNIGDSQEDARLTAAIVAMGRARGLCVVAEGVETEMQRRLLADWGCDEIQGYLISPAVPPEEAIALLGTG
jgi:diguanylate cyclase (GGDEF)-like protein